MLLHGLRSRRGSPVADTNGAMQNYVPYAATSMMGFYSACGISGTMPKVGWATNRAPTAGHFLRAYSRGYEKKGDGVSAICPNKQISVHGISKNTMGLEHGAGCGYYVG